MSIEKSISLIQFEINQMSKLLESYDLLIRKCKLSEPDLIELTAAASVLHSFYNGIENLFITIAKRIDGRIPQSQQWHRDLLKQMSEPTENRMIVISEETLKKLLEYMGFRHFFRHAYSFMLNWSEMKDLFLHIDEVWSSVKEDIRQFLINLKES